MKTTLTPTEAIELIREAHQSYLAALLPHPDENEHPDKDERASYREYDEAMNVALETLERMAASVLEDVEEGEGRS